jgi:4-amino-4-deoxy-L-arabinose transferase-like glycosyltransferase
MYHHFALEYNHGEISTGATSPLFVFLTAISYPVFKNWQLASLAVGVLSFVLAVFGGYSLANHLFSRAAAIGFVMVFLCSGRMMFHSLSGLDAMTFTAIALWLFWAVYRDKHYVWGILLGLLYLTRPDAAFFALPILIYVGIRKRSRAVIVGSAISFAIALPWLITCVIDNGTILPNSVISKSILAQHRPDTLTLGKLLNSLYRFFFLTHSHSAYHQYETVVGRARHGLSWLAQVKQFVPMFGLSCLALVFKERKKLWVIYAGFLLQFIAYVLFRKSYMIGGGHRYISLNYAVCFMSLAFLYVKILNLRRPKYARRLGSFLTVIILLVLFQDAKWQAGTYQAMGEYFHQMDGQVGVWIKKHTVPDVRIGLFQAGGVKFYGERDVIDFTGLIDYSILAELRQKGALRVILEKDIDYIAPFGNRCLDKYGVDVRDTRFFSKNRLPESRGVVRVKKREVEQYVQEAGTGR